MLLKRFNILLRFIRFDNANTRIVMLNMNLERAYVPGAALTVDEQLFPAKYGIKIWWICDSKSHFPLKGEIYAGKMPNDAREVE